MVTNYKGFERSLLVSENQFHENHENHENQPQNRCFPVEATKPNQFFVQARARGIQEIFQYPCWCKDTQT